ncbi:2-keto-4-pentenoate hydratase [Pelagerythrobacter rhizovicinus]|uniref:2-keto-4-pentenoate hydratase n=1 Tax=Pelagerythrobacter rhizovicinus TaxID=2268576 RepID=UPI00384B3E2E
MVNEDAAAIASRFLAARRTADGLSDYPGMLPDTLAAAYAVQDRAIAEWQRPIIGWKVGRIMPPLSVRFQADRLTGPIFLSRENGEDMPIFAKGFAAGEAEFLLRVGAAPPSGKKAFTLAEAADLIDAVHVGLEIASSPLGAINDIGPMAVISDFGNNNGLVIGNAIPDWRESGFEEWDVRTLIDGVEVGSGRAASFPDGAMGSARFLFELLAQRGIELAPGQWISTGAVTGVHDARPGQTVEAQFNGYSVECRLVEAEPE